MIWVILNILNTSQVICQAPEQFTKMNYTTMLHILVSITILLEKMLIWPFFGIYSRGYIIFFSCITHESVIFNYVLDATGLFQIWHHLIFIAFLVASPNWQSKCAPFPFSGDLILFSSFYFCYLFLYIHLYRNAIIICEKNHSFQ